MSGFVIKQGVTFLLAARVRDCSGFPVDLTGCSCASQLRDVLGNLVADLTVEPVTGRVGVIQFSSAVSTSGWPCGRFRCNLLIVWPDGTRRQSETFFVTVISAVTQVQIINAG